MVEIAQPWSTQSDRGHTVAAFSLDKTRWGATTIIRVGYCSGLLFHRFPLFAKAELTDCAPVIYTIGNSRID